MPNLKLKERASSSDDDSLSVHSNESGQSEDGKRRKFSKHIWSAEEDRILAEAIEKYGEKSWTKIAALLDGRVGKQCRDRWCNHLRPAVKKGNWTEKEDQLLFEAHGKYGNQWAEIARQILPGRTDLSVKNRYYSTLRRADRKQARADRVKDKEVEKTSRKRSAPTLKKSESNDNMVVDAEASPSLSNKKLRTVSPTNSPTNKASKEFKDGLKLESALAKGKTKENSKQSQNTKSQEEAPNKTDIANDQKNTGDQQQQSTQPTALDPTLSLAQILQQQQSLAGALNKTWAAGNLTGNGFSSLNTNLTVDKNLKQEDLRVSEPPNANSDLSAMALALFQLQNNVNPQILALQNLLQQSNQLRLAAALQNKANQSNKLLHGSVPTVIPRAYANGRAVSGAYPGTENTGRWSSEEHEKFLQGMKMFGNKNWTCIADVVKTRTVVQVRTHAQKYFKKLRKLEAEKGIAKENGDNISEASADISDSSNETTEKTNFVEPKSKTVNEKESFDQNINSANVAGMLLALQHA